MTLAEKFYREWFKGECKDGIVLTPEQWKIVRCLHGCLKEYNKPKLPHGTMLVERKKLIEHLNHVQYYLNDIDKAMTQPSTEARGKLIAKAWNGLNLSKDSIKHFQLDIPLERVNELIED